MTVLMAGSNDFAFIQLVHAAIILALFVLGWVCWRIQRTLDYLLDKSDADHEQLMKMIKDQIDERMEAAWLAMAAERTAKLRELVREAVDGRPSS